MRTVGLTGGIACGKSAVASLLRSRGVPVVDADQVARQVVAPGSDGLAAVVARFGTAVLQPDGGLDRAALRGIVSADADARKDLEGITHPRIFTGIRQWLDTQAEQDHPVAVVEAALMVETGSWRLYDALLVVACQPGTQLARLMARDGMAEADARRWLATQIPVAEKATYGTAVIWNDVPFRDGDRSALEAALDAAWVTVGPPTAS
jgi:dephospho-CoA kinase